MMVGGSLFANEDAGESKPFLFRGELWLGEQRISDADAPCNPLYKLRWSRKIQGMLQKGWTAPKPPQITVAKRSADIPSFLTIGKIEGELVRNGAHAERYQLRTSPNNPAIADIRLTLQTMFDDEYWLDTGMLSMRS